MYIIDLLNKTCQCRELQLNQFICVYGVAAYVQRGYSVYNYNSKYYNAETLRRTYAVVVHAFGSPNSWAVSTNVKSRVAKERMVRKLLGRPKKKRIESNGEEPSRPRCSRCGQAGRNKKTYHSTLPMRSTLSQSGNTSTRRSKRTQAQ